MTAEGRPFIDPPERNDLSSPSAPAALDFALALWHRGLSVIPVPRPGAGADGKRPVLAWKRYQGQRAAEADVRQWFAIDANIAIITGAVSGVVVVDSDSMEAELWARVNLPRTPWRVKTAKGWHRYYRHPGIAVSNKARILTKVGRIALDVRGDGGFAIGPGSVHASGASYQAVGDWSVPVAHLPAFWLGWIARPRPSVAPKASVSVPRGPEIRARRYLAAMRRPVVGEGSDAATYKAACSLVRGFRLSPAVAVNLLLDWSGFDRSWVELKVASALRYGQQPEGALLEGR